MAAMDIQTYLHQWLATAGDFSYDFKHMTAKIAKGRRFR